MKRLTTKKMLQYEIKRLREENEILKQGDYENISKIVNEYEKQQRELQIELLQLKQEYIAVKKQFEDTMEKYKQQIELAYGSKIPWYIKLTVFLRKVF